MTVAPLDDHYATMATVDLDDHDAKMAAANVADATDTADPAALAAVLQQQLAALRQPQLTILQKLRRRRRAAAEYAAAVAAAAADDDDGVHTGVSTRREESPSPPASDDASTTGRTCYDVTKLPPPHLRYVVSPLSSLPPVLRRTAASIPCFLSSTSRSEAGSGRALRKAATRQLFGA